MKKVLLLAFLLVLVSAFTAVAEQGQTNGSEPEPAGGEQAEPAPVGLPLEPPAVTPAVKVDICFVDQNSSTSQCLAWCGCAFGDDISCECLGPGGGSCSAQVVGGQGEISCDCGGPPVQDQCPPRP